MDDSIYWFNYVIFVESVSTSESMIPRPCFQALHTVYFLFYYMFARSDIYFRLHLLLIIITTTCISLSLRRTSALIHLTSVLGVLGTQETFCIVITGLLERDSFDLFLPEFDKPWVIDLRETWCCSTNLCTWRPNTVYKNSRVRRHHAPSTILLLNYFELTYKDGAHYIWAYTRKNEFSTIASGATPIGSAGRAPNDVYSWVGARKVKKEFINDDYSHRERGFYKSWLYNPNILKAGTVKQGCDVWFSSCVIATKLECHGWNISRR
jgi:hypothetical protein